MPRFPRPQFAWMLSGRIGAAGLQAAMVIFMARQSEPEQFGIVMAAQGIVLALSWFLGFGFAPYLSVVRSKTPDSPLVHQIFSLNARSGWLSGVSCLIVLLVAAQFDVVYYQLLPFALALVAQRDAAVWNSLALADGRTALFGSNLVLRRTLALVILAVFTVAGGPPALCYALGIAIAEIVSNYRLKRRVGFRPRFVKNARFGEVFGRSRHFWAETVFGQMRNLDIAVAGFVLGPIAAGLYAVPSRMASPLMLLPSSFGSYALPRVSRYGPANLKRLLLGAAVLLCVVAGILLFLGFNARLLITTLLGQDYAGAEFATQLYCVGLFSLSVITVTNSILQGLGKERAVAVSAGIGSISTLSAIGAGGWHWGLNGAASGYSFGAFIQLVTLGIFALIMKPKSRGRRRK